MAYCDIDDVRAAVAYRNIDGNTEPTSAQVVDFITQIASEIDMALAAKDYSVPIDASATIAYEFCKQTNIYGAAARVEAGSPKGDDSKHRDHYRKLYESALERITTGGVSLSDAARDTTLSNPRGGSGNPSAMFNLDLSL